MNCPGKQISIVEDSKHSCFCFPVGQCWIADTPRTGNLGGCLLLPSEHTQHRTGIASLAGSLSPGTQGHLQRQQILSRLVQSLQPLPTLPGKPEHASSSNTHGNNPALTQRLALRRRERLCVLLTTLCQLFPLPLYGNIPWPHWGNDAVGGHER